MIIGLNGYAKSGKNATADIIQKLFPERNFKIIGFSTVLKQVTELLTGQPAESLETQDVKANMFINITTGEKRHRKQLKGTVLLFETPCTNGYPENSWLSFRVFLQDIGTNCIRSRFPNAWVIAALIKYDLEFLFDDTPNWIMPDTRFINEAAAIKERKGLVIRIDRPGCKPINNHPSEVELDGWPFDHKIANVSDLKSLEFTIQTILKPLL